MSNATAPKEPRGPWGAGTVYQRASDNRWVAAATVSERPRKRKVFTAKTRDGAEAKLAAWRESNPPRVPLGRKEYMRLAREKGTHTEAEFWAKVREANRICAYCGNEIGPWDYHGDHIIPVSRGGSDAIDNIAVACKSCNQEKGTMTADEYAAWKAAR